MTATAWVLGRGGLLGAALERRLVSDGTRLFVPASAFAWRHAPNLLSQIDQAVACFARVVPTSSRWEIYWAAGIGTMGSRGDVFDAECQGLAALLAALQRSGLQGADGAVFLASSAGAIYAGSSEPVIDETAVERPTTAYAEAKLTQERHLRAFAASSGAAALIGRITTLYGAGQSSGKPQGLLSHISRCVVRNLPIQIYVPLDTIRDYISADDAAAYAIDALRTVPAGQTVVKIVASETPATISEIVGIFKRLARRPPRVVTGAAPLSTVYSRRIQFRSAVPPLDRPQATPLLVGIGQLLAVERQRFAAPASRRG